MWGYFFCVLGGLFGGYVLKDLISPETVIKGKIWQWGRNSNLSLNSEKRSRKKRFKRKDK